MSILNPKTFFASDDDNFDGITTAYLSVCRNRPCGQRIANMQTYWNLDKACFLFTKPPTTELQC